MGKSVDRYAGKMGRLMADKPGDGVLVNPHCRLSDTQVRLVDGVSRDLLQDPGLLCYNADAAEIFRKAGAKTAREVRERVGNEHLA